LSSVAFGFVSGRFFHKFSSIATSEVVLKSVLSCRFNLGALAVALGVEEFVLKNSRPRILVNSYSVSGARSSIQSFGKKPQS
jgi:hypothetical protein